LACFALTFHHVYVLRCLYYNSPPHFSTSFLSEASEQEYFPVLQPVTVLQNQYFLVHYTPLINPFTMDQRVVDWFHTVKGSLRSLSCTQGQGNLLAKASKKRFAISTPTRPHTCKHCWSIVLPGKKEIIRVATEFEEHHWRQPLDSFIYQDDIAFRLGVSLGDLQTASKAKCEFASYLLTSAVGNIDESLDPNAVCLFIELGDGLFSSSGNHLYFLVSLEKLYGKSSSAVRRNLRQCYTEVTGNSSEKEVFMITVPEGMFPSHTKLD
jgi:hypothetical protein